MSTQALRDRLAGITRELADMRSGRLNNNARRRARLMRDAAALRAEIAEAEES